MPLQRIAGYFGALGGFSLAAAVLLGAFGAHWLEGKLQPEQLKTYQTAVFYHFIHSLGLLVVGIADQTLPPSSLRAWSGICLVAGILLFSGSLYGFSLTGTTWVAMITPLGGIAFICGWVFLALSVWRHTS